MNINIIKKSQRITPKISIILLDWACREKYFALDCLNNQIIDRNLYELIWVELYNGVKEEVIGKTDTVIECNQKGIYHKHKGYNAGLLNANGEIITVCDSDAFFPPDFISSIIDSFDEAYAERTNLVLMHHEFRTKAKYPDNGIKNIEELKKFKWDPLWANVGACVSVRKENAINFGGFDEHITYKGFICGPYELAWRLVNAGFKQLWYDEKKTALWHFFHPHPVELTTIKMLKEISCSLFHIKSHAFAAIRAFSKGRIQPLKENKQIYSIRMKKRIFGSATDREYAEIDKLHYNLIKQQFISIGKFLRLLFRKLKS